MVLTCGYWRKMMRFRWRAKRKRLVLLLWIAIFALLVVVRPLQKGTLVYTLVNDRLTNLAHFRNMLFAQYRPMLWAHVSHDTLIKVFWDSRVSSHATLAACTRPARALNDVTGPLNPLEKLLASEPSGRPRPRHEDMEAYRRVWAWIDETAERRERFFRFGIRMTPDIKSELLMTWRVVHEALTLHNISHYLVAGALLGAFRHGGFIPWDDDMDIAVDGRDEGKIVRALSCIPGYTLRVRQNFHWKVFRSDAPVVHNHAEATMLQARSLDEAEKASYIFNWRLDHDVAVRVPYVDLYLMNQDDSHTWSFSLSHTKKYIYPLEEVYPLTRVPFEGLSVPVPRQSLSILNKIYKPYVCSSHHKDHINGKETLPYLYKLSTKCKELKPLYSMNNVRIREI